MSKISNLEDYRNPTPNTENSKVTNTRTKLQSHHLLPKYLGKMLGYTEKQMLDHPATLITQFSHTGKMNPNAMHKAISNYLPPMIRGNQAVYSNSQIRIGLQNAYNDIGCPELFNSISPPN
jgi:filamentous hemagglutinin